MTLYYILGAISYGIFLLQTLLSFVAGDIGFDVDFDGDVDFNGSDILSFKGLIHFLMGFSGWMMLSDKLDCMRSWSILVAVVIGIIFMIVLYFLYKLCLTLQHQPTEYEGKSIVGKSCKIYLNLSNNHWVVTFNGREITVVSKQGRDYQIGDTTTFIEYSNGTYYIP